MGAAGSVLRAAREEKEQLHEKTLNREVGLLQQDHFDMLYEFYDDNRKNWNDLRARNGQNQWRPSRSFSQRNMNWQRSYDRLDVR